MPAPAEIFNDIEISPPIPPLINIHLDSLLRAELLLGYTVLLDFVSASKSSIILRDLLGFTQHCHCFELF